MSDVIIDMRHLKRFVSLNNKQYQKNRSLGRSTRCNLHGRTEDVLVEMYKFITHYVKKSFPLLEINKSAAIALIEGEIMSRTTIT